MVSRRPTRFIPPSGGCRLIHPARHTRAVPVILMTPLAVPRNTHLRQLVPVGLNRFDDHTCSTSTGNPRSHR